MPYGLLWPLVQTRLHRVIENEVPRFTDHKLLAYTGDKFIHFTRAFLNFYCVLARRLALRVASECTYQCRSSDCDQLSRWLRSNKKRVWNSFLSFV